MGLSIKNIIIFLWLSFTAIIWLRLANPFYNLLFGELNWSFSWTARVTKWVLQIGFGMAIVGVGFVLPYQKFSDVWDKKFGTSDNSNDGGNSVYG